MYPLVGESALSYLVWLVNLMASNLISSLCWKMIIGMLVGEIQQMYSQKASTETNQKFPLKQIVKRTYISNQYNTWIPKLINLMMGLRNWIWVALPNSLHIHGILQKENEPSPSIYICTFTQKSTYHIISQASHLPRTQLEAFWIRSASVAANYKALIHRYRFRQYLSTSSGSKIKFTFNCT
jgi:hypothetical protein